MAKAPSAASLLLTFFFEQSLLGETLRLAVGERLATLLAPP